MPETKVSLGKSIAQALSEQGAINAGEEALAYFEKLVPGLTGRDVRCVLNRTGQTDLFTTIISLHIPGLGVLTGIPYYLTSTAGTLLEGLLIQNDIPGADYTGTRVSKASADCLLPLRPATHSFIGINFDRCLRFPDGSGFTATVLGQCLWAQVLFFIDPSHLDKAEKVYRFGGVLEDTQVVPRAGLYPIFVMRSAEPVEDTNTWTIPKPGAIVIGSPVMVVKSLER